VDLHYDGDDNMIEYTTTMVADNDGEMIVIDDSTLLHAEG
jgi:hypothetical protein